MFHNLPNSGWRSLKAVAVKHQKVRADIWRSGTTPMQNHLHLAQIDERFAPPAQTAAVRSGVQQSKPPQNPPRKWRTAAPAHPARKWGSDKYQWDNSVGRRRRERRDAFKTESAETVQTGNTSAEQVQAAGPPAESTDTPAPAIQAAAARPVVIKVTTTTAATGGTAGGEAE